VPPTARVPRQLRYRPFRGRDAVAAGLLTRRQLVGPTWCRLLPNVYLHRDVEPDHLTWCRAAVLALPVDGVVSHASAAYLYGADVLALNSPVYVSVPPKRVVTPHPRLKVRRTRLDAGDTRTLDRIPVTTPTRTAFDLARNLDVTEAVVGLDAILRRGVTDLATVRSYLDKRRDWPGAGRAATALILTRPLAESPMETRLRLLLDPDGLVLQHEVYVDGQRYRLDLAYPKVKVAIEYDGDQHRERDRFRADIRRLNALRAAGWTVLRFTADDLRHPERIRCQIAAVVG
jgi:very-short-patch-repair endonuclease